MPGMKPTRSKPRCSHRNQRKDTMNSEIYTAANNPISPMKDCILDTIKKGFFSKPFDLLPGNLVLCIDESIGFEVVLYAARRALESLAEEGHIVDTGRR